MSLDSRPAVVAELSTSATPPGAGGTPPHPATPTTLTEATDQGGNYSNHQPWMHRGFVMFQGDEEDGEGWSTPAYMAWRPAIDPLNIRGETLELNHPRFGFVPTREWFEAEVDRALEDRPQPSIIADGLGVLLCFALFGVVSCGVAVLA